MLRVTFQPTTMDEKYGSRNLADVAKEIAMEDRCTIPLAAIDTFTTQQEIDRFWEDYVSAIETTGAEPRTTEESEEMATKNIQEVVGRASSDARVIWESKFREAA